MPPLVFANANISFSEADSRAEGICSFSCSLFFLSSKILVDTGAKEDKIDLVEKNIIKKTIIFDGS